MPSLSPFFHGTAATFSEFRRGGLIWFITSLDEPRVQYRPDNLHELLKQPVGRRAIADFIDGWTVEEVLHAESGVSMVEVFPRQ